MTTTLEDDLRARAASLGMHRVGIAAATPIEDDHARYEAFVAAGFHGDMSWLADNAPVRAGVDTPDIVAGARSVVVCALAYHRGADQDEPSGPGGSSIARYARGPDDHNFFRKRLRRLADCVRELVPGSTTRAVVDTAPVLERAWARRAGVGFVGKNGMIIVPGLGSYVLLGAVITTAVFAPDEPMESRCGECTRCLDGCPTDAFAAPFVLDARRCISYLTIELREAIPRELRASIGSRLFGCDACQELCPYNRTAPPAPETTAQFAAYPRWRETDIADVANLDDARFKTLTAASPVSRAHRAGLARNASIVMGNSRDRRHLPVLREVRVNDPDPIVREAASWAIDTIEGAVDCE